MKAIRIHRFGGSDALVLDTVDRPSPAAGEVLVRLVASSINPLDCRIRAGTIPFVGADSLPYHIGCDVAGYVEEIGPGVSKVGVGDAVFAMPDRGRGAYAQFAIVSEDTLALAPRSLALADAAAVPLAALTAWQGLVEQGGLQRGQRVLILGAGGGVGQFAVQVAKAAGATVYATASGVAVETLRALGADMVLDGQSAGFADSLSEIDLILDLVGGELLDRCWPVLRPGGTVVSAVAQPSAELAAAAGAGSVARFVARPDAQQLSAIASLIDEGAIRVVIAGRYALADVGLGHDRLEAGGVGGKLLVLIDHDESEPT